VALADVQEFRAMPAVFEFENFDLLPVCHQKKVPLRGPPGREHPSGAAPAFRAPIKRGRFVDELDDMILTDEMVWLDFYWDVKRRTVPSSQGSPQLGRGFETVKFPSDRAFRPASSRSQRTTRQ
jgi:hypothetical protein